jgi:hypothetical protein
MFMAESIEKLSSFLPNEKKSITKNFYSDPEQFDLVTRKGVFPYEYLDNWDKLHDNCLPERQAFYSKINYSCSINHGCSTKAPRSNPFEALPSPARI